MRTAIAIITVSLALMLAAGTVFATTIVPDFPDWWKNAGDPPDGVTRIQAHYFHSDPNIMPSPDWVYDGFQPAISDVWDVGVIQAYDVDNTVGGTSPFYDSQNVHHGDTWAKVGIVAEGGGTMSKLMGNLADPSMIKLFHAEIIWYGSMDANAVTIDVMADGVVQSTGGVYTDTSGMWHLTWLDGTIVPQPDSETFNFNFATGGLMIDSAYIGTHCVPEPAALALLAFGGLMLIRRK